MAPTCTVRLHDDTWSVCECRIRLWFTARNTAPQKRPERVSPMASSERWSAMGPLFEEPDAREVTARARIEELW